MMWGTQVDREMTLVAVTGTCEVPVLLDLHLTLYPVFTALPLGEFGSLRALCSFQSFNPWLLWGVYSRSRDGRA